MELEEESKRASGLSSKQEERKNNLAVQESNDVQTIRRRILGIRDSYPQQQQQVQGPSTTHFHRPEEVVEADL